jgi:hypothetical protein
MNATRFESVLRALTIAPSRRRALRLLAALVLGSPVALGSPNAGAHNALKKCKKIADKHKRKQCKRQAKKHNAQHTNEALPPPGCSGAICDGACVTCATSELIDPETCDCCIPGEMQLGVLAHSRAAGRAHPRRSNGELPPERCIPAPAASRVAPQRDHPRSRSIASAVRRSAPGKTWA